jgi:hypothetical protein
VNKMNSKRSKIVYKFLLKSHRYFTLDTQSVQTVLPSDPVEKSKLNLTCLILDNSSNRSPVWPSSVTHSSHRQLTRNYNQTIAYCSLGTNV